MYATVPLSALLKTFAFFVIVIFVCLHFALGLPVDVMEWVRRASATAGIAGMTMAVVFGPSSEKFAPWRWVWRGLPFLNDWLFPDINGTWVGTGKSNYSRVEFVRAAAQKRNSAVNLIEIDQLELTSFQIAIFIKATLFDLRVMGKLGNTASRSHSLSARVEKGPDGLFRLNYSYDQETRNVGALDESNHQGAASLIIENCRTRLVGKYWTRRMWQVGMNTAGTFDLELKDRGRRTFDKISQ